MLLTGVLLLPAFVAAMFDLRIHAGAHRWSRRINLKGHEEIDVPLVGDRNLTFIAIPPGAFRMGSPEGRGAQNEWPAHSVNLTEFWVMKVPVTRAQFSQFVRSTGYKSDMDRGLADDCDGCFTYPSSEWTRYLARLPQGRTPCEQGLGCCNCDAWEPKHLVDWSQNQSMAQRDDFPVLPLSPACPCAPAATITTIPSTATTSTSASTSPTSLTPTPTAAARFPAFHGMMLAALVSGRRP